MPSNADRVKELTATTGTGTITLAGAVLGFQSFASAYVDQDIVYYCINDGSNWEVGQGTFSRGPNTLSRDSVVASSNGGALVNFPSAPITVFNTYPATAAVAMVKNSLSSQKVIRVAQDDNMIFVDELTLNGTAEILITGLAALQGVM